jgi:hypothetical protein
LSNKCSHHRLAGGGPLACTTSLPAVGSGSATVAMSRARVKNGTLGSMGYAVRRPVLALVVVAAGILGACSGAPFAGPTTAATTASPPLSIWNGTSIPVTLVVNDAVIETVAPGDRQDPITATLPAPPWRIELRSPAGLVLSTLTVSQGDYISNSTGRAVRADLSCGRLDLWSGPPLAGPTFIPGPSGDCG